MPFAKTSILNFRTYAVATKNNCSFATKIRSASRGTIKLITVLQMAPHTINHRFIYHYVAMYTAGICHVMAASSVKEEHHLCLALVFV